MRDHKGCSRLPPTEMAGRPRTRARKQALEQARKNGTPLLTETRIAPKHKYLADIYAEKYTTFEALRRTLIQNGIVDHGINPYDVIQRAIDDTTTDYLLLRRQIEKDTHGDPNLLVEHELYDYMERMREAMVRYSTFAMQYDIQKRQLKLSETRVAVLAQALRQTLQTLNFTPDQIREAPKLLIEAVVSQQPKENTHHYAQGPSRFDPVRAEAMAEILHHDADIELVDIEEDTPDSQ